MFRFFTGRTRTACAAALTLTVILPPAACFTTSSAEAQTTTRLPPVVVEAAPRTKAKSKAKGKSGYQAPRGEPANQATGGISKDVTATEGSSSYASDYTSVGSKSPTQFKESTQSVSVVTQQRLRDQNLNTVEEALAQTAGVTVNPTASGFSQVLMRGYFLDTVQVDGMPYLLSTSLLTNAADLGIYDHVEVLRGADGMFQGAGYAGGVVNLVRKHALDREQVLTSTSIGSWNNYHGMLDITGPLNQAGTLRGRVVSTYENRDYFYDTAKQEKGVVYGTLEADLSRSTTLSIGATKQDSTAKPFFGLPAYNNGIHPDLARSTFAGADWNRDSQAMTDLFTELEHRFDNGGHIKISGRQIDRSRDAKYAYTSAAANPVTNLVSLATTASQYDVEQSDVDAHLYTPFRLFGLNHSILAGADYKRYYSDFRSGNGAAVTQNIFALNPNITEPNIAFTSRTGVLTEQEGVYAQLRLRPMNGVIVVLGDRLTNWENTTENLITHKTTLNYSIDNRQTPYAGLIVDLTQELSAYGSYTDIFSPQGSMQADGTGMPPRIGTQYETGLKGKFLDGRLNVSTALFYIRDTGRALSDPLHPGYFLPAGLSESKGFEAEISGALAAGWQVYGGYSYVYTEYLEAAAADKGGSMLPMLPRHNINLWTTYNFQDEALKKFTVGGGIKAVTDFYRKVGNVKYSGDGYIVANAMVGYKINDNVSLGLNVNNIFDEVYFQNVGPSQNFYGEPRSVMLRLDTKF